MITGPVRVAIEDPAARHALIAFAEISHPELASPIRVASDVVDYMRDGFLWRGVPFGYKLVRDGDGNPTSRMRIDNIDRTIGPALRVFRGRPTVRLEICSSADFDLGVIPREPLGAVTPIMGFRDFHLVNISVDALEITADVILQDYAQEPFPSFRATQDRTPGLFR